MMNRLLLLSFLLIPGCVENTERITELEARVAELEAENTELRAGLESLQAEVGSTKEALVAVRDLLSNR